MNKNIAILGASPKEERYANMCQKLLVEKGYSVYPINPVYDEIDGKKCYKSLVDIIDDIDTITVYMNPERFNKVMNDILQKKPKRVIFNPGTESDEIKKTLIKEGIEVVEACTLVMLKTGQF
ncbi:MAG TPA: CoA-binding protein [Spirochaetota bacterium]|nr:CoA-binding protein [Spirochaetota bacterium]